MVFVCLSMKHFLTLIGCKMSAWALYHLILFWSHVTKPHCFICDLHYRHLSDTSWMICTILLKILAKTQKCVVPMLPMFPLFTRDSYVVTVVCWHNSRPSSLTPLNHHSDGFQNINPANTARLPVASCPRHRTRHVVTWPLRHGQPTTCPHHPSFTPLAAPGAAPDVLTLSWLLVTHHDQ